MHIYLYLYICVCELFFFARITSISKITLLFLTTKKFGKRTTAREAAYVHLTYNFQSVPA